MIILTAAQASKVRGISPIDGCSALDPIPLKDGTFALPDEVIDDPAHEDVQALLQSCPKGLVLKANTYNSAQPGDTAVAAKAKMAADAAALAAKGVPNYRSVTRTDPRPKPPVDKQVPSPETAAIEEAPQPKETP